MTIAQVCAGGFCAQELISRVTTKKNILEDFIPTPEDARRVFIAKSIVEITSRLGRCNHPGKTLLVVYRGAHISRVIEYLRNYNTFKEGLYKLSLPGLDYHVRRYRPAEGPTESSEGLSGWKLVETIPL